MFSKKRAMSPVVATLLLVVLVIVIMVIIFAFVRNFTEEKIESAESCFDVQDKVLLNPSYTCYNDGSLDFSIEIKDVEVEKILVAVSRGQESKSFELYSGAKVSEVANYHSTSYGESLKFPSQNSAKSYTLNTETFFSESTSSDYSVKISPVVNGEQCAVTSKLFLESCSSDYVPPEQGITQIPIDSNCCGYSESIDNYSLINHWEFSGSSCSYYNISKEGSLEYLEGKDIEAVVEAEKFGEACPSKIKDFVLLPDQTGGYILDSRTGAIESFGSASEFDEPLEDLWDSNAVRIQIIQGEAEMVGDSIFGETLIAYIKSDGTLFFQDSDGNVNLKPFGDEGQTALSHLLDEPDKVVEDFTITSDGSIAYVLNSEGEILGLGADLPTLGKPDWGSDIKKIRISYTQEEPITLLGLYYLKNNGDIVFGSVDGKTYNIFSDWTPVWLFNAKDFEIFEEAENKYAYVLNDEGFVYDVLTGKTATQKIPIWQKDTQKIQVSIVKDSLEGIYFISDTGTIVQIDLGGSEYEFPFAYYLEEYPAADLDKTCFVTQDDVNIITNLLKTPFENNFANCIREELD